MQLATSLTADPGVASLIPTRSQSLNNFQGHSPSADSRRVVSYKGKYVHEVLVNGLVSLPRKKYG